jgi:chromosome segregation ATPase
MSELLRYVNDPEKLFLVMSLGVTVTLGAWLKDRLVKEFDEMKETVRGAGVRVEQTAQNLSDRIGAYQAQTAELAGEVAKLRRQIIEDVGAMLARFESIRLELARIQSALKDSSSTFEEQTAFVARIRNDLEQIHGRVQRIDAGHDGLKISVAKHKEMFDQIHSVLVAHNQSIKKIGGK